MKKRLAIFKAGKHRSIDGRVYEFSDADVAGIADRYDTAVHHAPYVLGHPKIDAPAWGWADKVEAEGGVLYAEGGNIDAAFSDAVDAGRYRFRSAAFYGPNDAGNPTPGAFYLRHVGFLGAQPPSVKGLGPAFGEGDAGEFIAFGNADGFWAKDLFRGLRDWIIDKFDLATADKVLPTYAIDNVDREDPARFSESAPDVDAVVSLLDSRSAALDTREAALKAREDAAVAQERAAFAEARTAARADDGAFVDELVTGGKLPPGHAPTVKTLLGLLDGDGEVAFSEGEPPARDQFRTLLSGLGEVIAFSEIAPAEGARFAESRSADHHAAAIQAVMAEHEAAGRPISAAQAASIARQR